LVDLFESNLIYLIGWEDRDLSNTTQGSYPADGNVWL